LTALTTVSAATVKAAIKDALGRTAKQVAGAADFKRDRELLENAAVAVKLVTGFDRVDAARVVRQLQAAVFVAHVADVDPSTLGRSEVGRLLTRPLRMPPAPLAAVAPPGREAAVVEASDRRPDERSRRSATCCSTCTSKRSRSRPSRRHTSSTRSRYRGRSGWCGACTRPTEGFFFLSREVQDHAYGALLATCASSKMPANPSMSSAAKLENAVRMLLDEEAPGYWDWFHRWRTLRNKLKDGISVHLVGGSADLGIAFTIERGDAHLGQHKVRLVDATETLERSVEEFERTAR